MPRFDLNLLNALDVLLNERNVTRAAERLHVTQPTMSGMLQRLRYQFEDQLLVRNGRNMELTPFALSLIEPVREALTGVQSLVRAQPAFDPATSRRTFTVMASDYCTLIFMPRVMARIAHIAPGVRLAVQPLNAPVEKMMSGEIDLCISTDNKSLLSKEAGTDILLSAHLFSDRFVALVADDHPLTAEPELDDYLGFPHVGVQMAGNLDTIEANALRQYAPDYQPAFTVPDFSMIPRIVAHSDLVGVVQNRLARMAPEAYNVRSVVPPFPIPRINETMFWHPRHADEASHAWLRDILAEEADCVGAEDEIVRRWPMAGAYRAATAPALLASVA
ncbi:LysR family transcriptional regulator [Sphingobium chungangianum]